MSAVQLAVGVAVSAWATSDGRIAATKNGKV